MATSALTLNPGELATSEAEQSAPRRRSWFKRCIFWIYRGVGSVVEWLFGFFSMVIGLSVLATIPVLQFLSLGYLLEISGCVARSGRIRDAWRDVRSWARVGGAALATWLWLQPLRLLADLRYSALLLGNVEHANQLQTALIIAALLLAIHLAWAIFRGGRFWHFVWPAPLRLLRRCRQGGMVSEARRRAGHWIVSLNASHYLWLGLQGILVALVWLAGPISLMVVATRLAPDGAALLSLVAGMWLAAVLLYLPFLQVNLAQTGALQAGFDVRRVRRQFSRAPLAFWLALLFTLTLALPLYVLKAELIPREAAWLPSIVFVVSILPARILTGWAVARGERRESPRHFIFRHTARALAIPVVLFYVLIVYLTQYVSWYGVYSLYEQHAFMLPVPFVGL